MHVIFFEKYKNDIKEYQFADQEVLSFEHHTFKKQEFIGDIAHHLENDGHLIMIIFMTS